MRKLLPILLLTALCSCNAVSSLLHDDQVVAKVGKEKLYRSELEALIPDFISPEDSAGLASDYINSWAAGILFAQKAEANLSKSEMDVAKELEDYRQALLKYRYEQRFINERLDTLITNKQIEAYYDAHQEDFILSRPVLKVRFVDVMKTSPQKNDILKMMSSESYDDYSLADTIAHSSALKYFDSSDTWMDAAVLAGEFGIQYEEMLKKMDGKFIKVEPEDRDDVKVAYVCDICKSGPAPMDYCRPQIRDLILSERKHSLVTGLERDLLKDALSHKQLVIYK